MTAPPTRTPSWRLRIWNVFGPGLVTGAADDDPSGIATYSQAGAQYGYDLAWTMFLILIVVGIVNYVISRRLRASSGS